MTLADKGEVAKSFVAGAFPRHYDQHAGSNALDRSTVAGTGKSFRVLTDQGARSSGPVPSRAESQREASNLHSLNDSDCKLTEPRETALNTSAIKFIMIRHEWRSQSHLDSYMHSYNKAREVDLLL